MTKLYIIMCSLENAKKSIAWMEADRVLNICASAINRVVAMVERTIFTSGNIMALQCDDDVDFSQSKM